MRIAGESVAGTSGGASAGTAMCAVMIGIHAGIDGGLERHQFEAFEPFPVGGDGGQVHVRVHGGVAVPREMFGGGQREVLLVGVRPFDEGPDVRRDVVRILAEGADVDDRIIGIVVDVGDRVKDPLDAQRARLARGDLAFVAGQRRIARGAERHGVRKNRGAFEPHGSAALEISRHHQRHRGEPLHPIHKRGDLVRLGLLNRAAVRDVVQDEAADFGFVDQADELAVFARPDVRRFAVKGDEDELRDFVARGHVPHPAANRGGSL